MQPALNSLLRIPSLRSRPAPILTLACPLVRWTGWARQAARAGRADCTLQCLCAPAIAVLTANKAVGGCRFNLIEEPRGSAPPGAGGPERCGRCGRPQRHGLPDELT